MDVIKLMLVSLAGWINQEQEHVIDYLREEIRTLKEQMIPIGEGALRRAVDEFCVHHHRERNHQGLENKLIEPEFCPRGGGGEVKCCQRLGGLLRYYYRDAA